MALHTLVPAAPSRHVLRSFGAGVEVNNGVGLLLLVRPTRVKRFS
ncbi:hypothetical protein MPL3356_400004 [Mesorhizobium plurifarium]|uniref:Uncharacterized protein n=1 Tax=Mesorhizobium plurifarium TaxID=69974 RepID=A0A090E9P8_MESPL|nr:hypothetical protein MPL3356_400004 [Mesorhizobium plurifarium]